MCVILTVIVQSRFYENDGIFKGLLQTVGVAY